MAEITVWAFPPDLQPSPDEVAFDLKPALDAVVSVRAEIPDEAFTAGILGTERTGNGVVIREDGLVLTIGYLITEAQTIWLTNNAGAAVEGQLLGAGPPQGVAAPGGALRLHRSLRVESLGCSLSATHPFQGGGVGAPLSRISYSCTWTVRAVVSLNSFTRGAPGFFLGNRVSSSHDGETGHPRARGHGYPLMCAGRMCTLGAP